MTENVVETSVSQFDWVYFSPSIDPSLPPVMHKHSVFPGRPSKFYICAISGSEDKPLPICSEPDVTLSGTKGNKATLLKHSVLPISPVCFYVLLQ